MGQAQIGIDIIEIERIEETVSRWGERFLKRIYTQNEIDLCGGRVSSLAARFAAKEAVMKALNSGQDTILWREIGHSRWVPGDFPSEYDPRPVPADSWPAWTGLQG